VTKVHILTPGFTSPNGRAFLFPLLLHRRHLIERGIGITLFKSDRDPAALSDCDVLIVDSKYYSPRWIKDTPAVLAALANLRQQSDKLFYFDITDSSGWDHARALPHVTAYFKNQLLKDRSLYLKPVYGYRVYSDSYHRSEGVRDPGDERSEPVADPGLLGKLHLGWNSCLADYSLQGEFRMSAYRYARLPGLLRAPNHFTDPAGQRPLDLSCRVSTSYRRNTIKWQRQAIRDRLANRISTERVSRRRFVQELRDSKIVLSPFGFGEICYRDFEGFLAGAALLKPDMSHMETWPDLYRDDETMMAHRWDLSDLEERIEALLGDDKMRLRIAKLGQDLYRRHLVGEAAAVMFGERFEAILKIGEASGVESEAGAGMGARQYARP